MTILVKSQCLNTPLLEKKILAFAQIESIVRWQFQCGSNGAIFFW